MSTLPTTQAPAKIVRAEVVSDPTAEYIASSQAYNWAGGDFALPRTLDDAERLWGWDLYDRKMIHDPELAPAIRYIKATLTKGGVDCAPSHDAPDPGEPDGESKTQKQTDHDEAMAGVEFIQYNLSRLRWPDQTLIEVVEEGLDCVYTGNRLAEINTDFEAEGPYAGERVLTSVKMKDRHNYAFVVKSLGGLVGICAVIPGKTPYVREGIVFNPPSVPNLIAPDKVMVFRFGGKNGDPRGESCFRDAYDAWLSDRQDEMRADQVSHQFAGGRTYAVIDADAVGNIDPVKIANTLSTWMPGQAICLPKGVTPSIDYPKVDPSWFEARRRVNRERKVMSVLINARGILSAERGSEKDSGVAQDVGEEVIAGLKRLVERTVESQLYYSLCLWWKGKAWADKYTPKCVLGSSVSPDFSKNITALATAGYTIDDSQVIPMEKAAGIPVRSPDWIQKRDERAAAEAELNSYLAGQTTAKNESPQSEVKFKRAGVVPKDKAA